MLGKVLQPLFANVVADRRGYHEGDNQRKCIALGEERQHLANATAHYFANGNLLTAILCLEHREAEDADKRDEDANEGKEFDLSDETELLVVCFLQTIIKEI